MTIFVRNQILTPSFFAVFGQANSYPHMHRNWAGRPNSRFWN